MSSNLPENFCIMPWINASIDVNGAVRPCCKYVQPSQSKELSLGNLGTENIQEIWGGKAFENLRQEFLSNGKPIGCRTCWDEEAAGIESYRKTFVRGSQAVDLSQIKIADLSEFKKPITLDLKTSNKCNLKCRICGPIASSAYLAEDLENQTGFQIGATEKMYLTKEKFFGVPENEQWLIDTLKNCKHIEMTGGEPLLSIENRKIEQLAIDMGVSGQISLSYNTNVSVFSLEVVKSWAKFKSVVVCLSIDDVFERYEYQRFPAKWSTVERNLTAYKNQVPKNTRLIIFCSVSTLNVFYLKEILTWFIKNYPEIDCYLNIVHNDNWFNIQNSNAQFKKEVTQKLGFLSKDLEAANQLQLKLQVDELVRFLNLTNHLDLSEKLKTELEKRDRIRNQNYRSTFPDILL